MALDNLNQNAIQGRVAIGEKSDGKSNGYPKKLDYFIFTKNYDPKLRIAPKYKEMSDIMEKKYGTKQPKCVSVTFVDHHPHEVFYTDFLNYPGTICNCKGNGEEATRTDDNGVKTKVKCDYDNCKFRLKKTDKGILNTCKPTGILTFMMPEAPVAGGLWKFVTHSYMSIGKINASLKNIHAIRKTLFGLQCNIKVVIVQTGVGGKTQNVPTVEVEVPFSWDAIAAGAGTTIGTLMDAQAKFMAVGMKEDEKKVEAISCHAETIAQHDGDLLEPSAQPANNKKEEVIDAEIDNAPITKDDNSGVGEPPDAWDF